MSTIAIRIFKTRKEKGLSQSQLAKRIGVAVSTVSHAENAYPITSTTLRLIARGLGVSFNWLQFGSETVTPCPKRVNRWADTSMGDRVRDLRTDEGLTQEELAHQVNSTQAAIQKLENGHVLRPRFLEPLAHYFRVTPAWLAYGDEYPRSRKIQDLVPMLNNLPNESIANIRNAIISEIETLLNEETTNAK